MVDAARQMLDELMGRNRNLHPSEAVRKISWEDSDFCQYYIVKFCPHDLFVNTRADLGPCQRLHDEEAKEMYNQARPSARKRQFEDEFLRFCMTMLNDVDRKILKGKQRLQLMNKDQPVQSVQAKFQEQVNNLNARINKLLSEAEEAGTRGDVDQAQDLMSLCEKLKAEKDVVHAQYENHLAIKAKLACTKPSSSLSSSPTPSLEPAEPPLIMDMLPPPVVPSANDDSNVTTTASEVKPELAEDYHKKGSMDNSIVNEKQMEVCETCGAFLIVGDAQQRIEDHLMGKQHLGYSRLRKAVDELHEKRLKERQEEAGNDTKGNAVSGGSNRRQSREPRENRERDNRSRGHDHRRHSRDRHQSSRRSNDKYRHGHRSNHHDGRSRSRSHRRSRGHSRSRSHSHSHNRH